MIVRPPGDPVINTTLPFFETIAGVIELSMRLPGSIRFAGVPIVPSSVVTPGFLLKSPISLVQQEPGAFDDDARAVAAFERERVADGHPVAIDHREVRRLVRLLRCRGDD